MDRRTILKYEAQLRSIFEIANYEVTFTATEAELHGNVVRSMWKTGILERVGTSGKAHTYKISKFLKSDIEGVINNEVN